MLVVLGTAGCTQVRFERGHELRCYAEKFRPGDSDYDHVLRELGPPWMLTRTAGGFAFLYEHVKTLENQLGVSFDTIFSAFGIDRVARNAGASEVTPGGLSTGSMSIADWIKLLYAWEKGEVEALIMEFDHRGALMAVGYVKEDLDLGSTFGVSLIISASPKVGSMDYKASPEQLEWGMAMLRWMPESLNQAQDLHLGQAGLTRVPAGFYVGNTVTVPRASETRREKKRDRRN